MISPPPHDTGTLASQEISLDSPEPYQQVPQPAPRETKLLVRAVHGLRNLFSFDLRSLALFRVGLAILVLTDLALRAKCLLRDYSDLGLLPRSIATAVPQYSSLLSLHLVGGAPYVQAALFLVAAVVATLLLLGIRARACLIATWVLLVSLQARNPLILHSGDMLLALIIFWGMFLPVGSRFSVDSASDKSCQDGLQQFFGLGTVAFVIQLTIVYLSSGWTKIHTGHWWDGSAVGNALQYDYVVTPFGLWLRQFEVLGPALTYGTLAIEFAAPALLLCPFRNQAVRLATVILLWTTHFAFGMCFEIGLFPWICFVMLLPFLPASFWTWLQYQRASLHGVDHFRFVGDPNSRPERLLRQWVSGCLAFLSRWPRSPLPEKGLTDLVTYSEPSILGRDSTSTLPLGWLSRSVCALALIWVVLWNGGRISGKQLLPDTLMSIGVRAGLGQNWSVFVDKNIFNGWYVIDGICRDGSHVDLVNGRQLSWDKLAVVSSKYDSYRLRLYLERIARKGFADFREPFADYLRNSWNASHSLDKAIDSIAMYYMINRTFEDEQRNFPDVVLLYIHDWRDTGAYIFPKQRIREHLP